MEGGDIAIDAAGWHLAARRIGSRHLPGRLEKLPCAVRKQLQKKWGNGYGRAVVKHLGSPEIWCIGKTTFDILAQLMSIPGNHWIYQPRASNVELERNWPALRLQCNKLLRAQNSTSSTSGPENA